jgi:hypothetical protein
MGILRPLALLVAWDQPRIGVRNPEAARPAIALRKKDLLFIRMVMLVVILIRRMRNGEREESTQGSDGIVAASSMSDIS